MILRKKGKYNFLKSNQILPVHTVEGNPYSSNYHYFLESGKIALYGKIGIN